MDFILAGAIGFVVGAAAVWVFDRRVIFGRSGRDYHFGWDRSSFAPLRRSPQQLSPDQIEQLRRYADLMAAIPGSPLHGVIGVGASVSVADLTVELIAIEVRDAGGRVTLNWRAHGGKIGGGPSITVIGEPEVTVADDVGTRYELGPGGSSSHGDGGEAEFSFAPRPPAEAHHLRIVVERFRESRMPPGYRRSGPPAGVPGPWAFTVEIADHLAAHAGPSERNPCGGRRRREPSSSTGGGGRRSRQAGPP